MAQKTLVQLTADLTSVVTSQTAPESITPTTLGAFVQDVLDSMVDKEDTFKGLSIPAFFQQNFVLVNGDSPQKFVQNILDAIDYIKLLTSNTAAMDPQNFSAIKTKIQSIPNISGNYRINFEDDFTSPFFDTGNHFFTDRYVANASITKTFIVEKLKLKASAQGSTDTYRVRILKNGVEIATSTNYGAGLMRDAYQSNITSATGFEFPPIVATNIAMVSGDVITAELVLVHGNGNLRTIEAGAIFSNS